LDINYTEKLSKLTARDWMNTAKARWLSKDRSEVKMT